MKAMRLFLSSVVVVVLAIGLAACTSVSSSAPKTTTPSSNAPTGITKAGTGVIAGYADSCSGLMEHVHVKVVLYRGTKLIASETVRSGASFRFSVTPGSYKVRADHRSVQVTVRAGRTVTASLLTVCL